LEGGGLLGVVSFVPLVGLTNCARDESLKIYLGDMFLYEYDEYTSAFAVSAGAYNSIENKYKTIITTEFDDKPAGVNSNHDEYFFSVSQQLFFTAGTVGDFPTNVCFLEFRTIPKPNDQRTIKA
jgi:hypothetical protein